MRSTPATGPMLRCSGLLFAALIAPDSAAQNLFSVAVPAQGSGSVGLSVLHADIHRAVAPPSQGGGFRELGDITLRSATLEVDYGLTDRLALSASLPFKSNRYIGDNPHDPSRLQNDHGERLRDDGRYHGNWGDWGLGLRYQWLREPIAITPFVAVHWPSNTYPIYTLTAAGTRQKAVDLGANFGGPVPGPWRNLYWQFGYAYTFVEKTRPINLPAHRVNHSIASFELGYLIDPQWSMHATWRYRRAYNALTPPQDFNFNFTNDLWYYHDQLFPLEQSVFQLALNYRFNDRYTLSGSLGKTVHVAFGSEIERALTLGISRGF